MALASSRPPAPVRVVNIVVGRKGGGKSTVLNWWLREPRFKAGLSFGPGTTDTLETYVNQQGDAFAKAPGWNDPARLHEVAVAIDQALRLGDHVRVFVVVPWPGCVVHGDADFIAWLLGSFPVDSWAVILNQVSEAAHKHLTENPKDLKAVLRQACAKMHPDQQTDQVFIQRRLQGLAGVDDFAGPLDDLVRFMEKVRVGKTIAQPMIDVRPPADARSWQEEEEFKQKQLEVIMETANLRRFLRDTPSILWLSQSLAEGLGLP